MLLLFFSLLVYKSDCDEKDILICNFVYIEKSSKIIKRRCRMKSRQQCKLISRTKELEISLEVKPICKKDATEIMETEICKEKAQQETRRIMDDIWKRYPMAEVSRVNFDSNRVVFEL